MENHFIYNRLPCQLLSSALVCNLDNFALWQTRLRNEITFSGIADFQIGDYTFEVGGRHKGQQQIEQASHGFIVKDDIDFPMLNIIPLWHFGLNY